MIWKDKKRERRGKKRDLEKEEVRRVLEGLKDGKALGVDGVPNEMWKYRGWKIEE